MLLPVIAKLFCVTIDDLYRQKSVAYENYAQRLAAVYEASRRPEDFVRADSEYLKLIKSGKASENDLRMYGIIHQYMMNYCAKKAMKLYDDVLKAGVANDEEVYWKTKRQKILLLSQTGMGTECTEMQLKAVKEHPESIRELELLITSYYLTKQYDKAYKCFKETVEKFPDDKFIWFCGGDVCKKLQKYDEAFLCRDTALKIDNSFYDAKYSKGFCYEETGEYEKAYEIWKEIARDLANEGYDVEKAFPEGLAEKCRNKIERV